MSRPIPSGLRVTAVVVAVLFALPVLYVASMGPAYRMAEGNNVSTFDRVYAPLWWLRGRYPDSFGRFFEWYAGWGEVDVEFEE